MARKGNNCGTTSSGCDIFIYMPLTKETFKFPDVQLSTKVLEVKKNLELVMGIPLNMQRLFYLDREDLKDTRDLRSCDIVTSATLNLHIWRSWEKIIFNVFIGNQHELVKLKQNKTQGVSNEQWRERCQQQVNVALYVAANKGRGEIVDYLLEEGADVNWQTGLGRTPLHAAAAQGRLDCIKLLLERGATTDQIDKFGKTASKVANEHGFKESEKQLFLFQWQERAKTIKIKEPCSTLMMHQQFDSGYPTWLRGKCQQIYMSNISSSGTKSATHGKGVKQDAQEMLDEKEDMDQSISGKETDPMFLPRIQETPSGHISGQREVLKQTKTFDDWLMKKNQMTSRDARTNLSAVEKSNFDNMKKRAKTRKDAERVKGRHLVDDEKPRRKVDIYDSQEHNGGFEKEFLNIVSH